MPAKISNSPTIEYHNQILDMVSAGKKVINLTAGESDIPTPRCVVDAAIRSLENAETKYSSSPGLLELRSLIAEKHGAGLSSEKVTVTSSGKMAIFSAMAALLSADDTLVIFSPTWPSYRTIAEMLNVRVVELEYELLSNIAALQRSLDRLTPKMVIVCNPNNPTSAFISLDRLSLIADSLRKKAGYLLVDEIYIPLTSLFPSNSATSLLHSNFDNVVVVGGFSKAFSMTGWRLGYIISSLFLSKLFVRIVENTTSCSPVFVQRAAIAALTEIPDHPKRMASILNNRALDFKKGLEDRALISSCTHSDGSFYLWMELSSEIDPTEFASQLLRCSNIAVLPGAIFGTGGKNNIRISLNATRETLIKAAKQIRYEISNFVEGRR